MKGKKGYHHGNLRKALVDSAMAMLEREGIEELSLRALAEALGVSKSAPYRHFASRQELLAALAAEGFGEFALRLEASAAASASKPAAERLGDLTRAYVDFAREHPALYRLMFSRFGYSLHSEACRANSARALTCLIDAVERAQDEGWRRNRLTNALVLSIWAEVHGWVGLLTDGLIPEGLGFEEASWQRFAGALLD